MKKAIWDSNQKLAFNQNTWLLKINYRSEFLIGLSITLLFLHITLNFLVAVATVPNFFGYQNELLDLRPCWISVFLTGWFPDPSKHLRTHIALTSTTVSYMLKCKHVVKSFGKQGWAWREVNAVLEHGHRWEGMTVIESWQDTGNDSFRAALRMFLTHSSLFHSDPEDIQIHFNYFKNKIQSHTFWFRTEALQHC